MRKPFLLFLAAVTAAASLVGCGGGGSGIINVPNPRVRFFNAFEGVTNANARVGTDVVAGGTLGTTAYGQVSEYAITENGTKDFTAGQTTFNDLATLSNQLFEENRRYTAIGYGADGSRQILLVQENELDAATNTVEIRVAHAAQSVGNVDIYVSPGAGSPLPGTATAANVAPGAVSDFFSLAAGASTELRVRVYAAGDTTTPLFDNTLTVGSTERYLLVAHTASGGGGNVAVTAVREDR